MPAPRRLRIALVGLGDIAQKAYLPLLCAHADVTPVLCTRNATTLSRLARRYRVTETYADVDQLAGARLDAAMVHSATKSHEALSRKLLAMGLPLFVDKPLADSLAGAERIVAQARASDLPLFVGFNRRYAPLIGEIAETSDLHRVSWRKHRHNLPGAPRTFVFDDFIHVVDGLRHLGRGDVRDVRVFCRKAHGQLLSVDVQWVQGEALLSGSMHRDSGRAEETVEAHAPGLRWRVEELSRGTLAEAGAERALDFGNWVPTLEKRGFVAMAEAWLATVRRGGFDEAYAAGVLETHRLCERIVREA